MKEFTQFLNERFVNAFSTEEKTPLADEVWDIIQKSYAKIGGIHGSGFKNKQNMIDAIPMWKAVRKNGKIVAVALYKDKEGRKRVAVGTDGSEDGKKGIFEIAKHDFTRAYFEVSGPSFGSLKRELGIEFLKQYVKSVEEAEYISGEKFGPPDESDKMFTGTPELQKYMYSRDIGGTAHTKIMFGTNGKKIVVRD